MNADLSRRTRAGLVGTGLLLCAAPVIAYFQLLLAATVDVPNLDDYDTVVSFLNRFVDQESLAGRLRLVFAPHIEHRPAFLRVVVAASYAALGRLDFDALNVFGSLGLVVLLCGLFLAFRWSDRVVPKPLAFAPAVLLLFHPQYWSALLWTTGSVANFYVVAFALLAFLALQGASKAAIAAAGAFSFCAVFSQGNGFLTLPLGVLTLFLAAAPRRWRVAGSVFAALLLAIYFASYERPEAGVDPSALLREPQRFVGYGLNFLGSAAAFSRRGFSLAAGGLLLASFVALAWRGYPRRNPALFCLLLFIFMSVGLNAGVRAIQGVEAPLGQPRYRFYAALILAVSYLAWAETLRGTRASGRILALSLIASIVFSSLSFARYRGDVFALAARLERGLDSWWQTGSGGLAYPRVDEASGFLTTAIGKGIFAVPQRWIDDGAVAPVAVQLPEPDPGVAFQLGTIFQDDAVLLLDGWAHMGGLAEGQEVLVALRSAQRSYVFPARGVFRASLARKPPDLRRKLGPSGFRAILDKRDVVPDTYRIGILVRRGATEHLTFRGASVVIVSRSG